MAYTTYISIDDQVLSYIKLIPQLSKFDFKFIYDATRFITTLHIFSDDFEGHIIMHGFRTSNDISVMVDSIVVEIFKKYPYLSI